MQKKLTLPMIPLRGLVVLPYMILHFDVGRQKSIKALDAAAAGNGLIFLAAQVDEEVTDPTINQIYNVGTIAKITQIIRLPGGAARVLVEGVSRGELLSMNTDDYVTAEVLEYNPVPVKVLDDTFEALIRKLQESCEKYFAHENRVPPETLSAVISSEDPGRMCDLIAGNMDLSVADKQLILESHDPKERLENLLFVIAREFELAKIEQDIDEKVKKSMDKNQRDYYLREQLHIIQEELGDKDGIGAEINEYREKFAKLDLPEDAAKKVEKELDRLFKTPPGVGEGSMIRNYLDWVADLPWNISTKDSVNISKARKILDADHYGLEKVKERIIEYLAV